MKNPVKSYFCFMSRAPFLIVAGVSLLLFFIFMLLSIIFYSDASNNVPDSVILKPFGIYLAFAVLHIILNYVIRAKYITYIDDDESYVLFAVLITKDNRKIIVTKPIWAVWEKGELYLVKLEYESYITKEFNIWFNIDSRFKHSTISIPGNIEMKIKDDFDKLELFDALLKNNTTDEKIFFVISFFKKSFEKLNESNQVKIDEIVSEYGEKNISESELLNRIIDLLIFPEIPFSGFETKNICLKVPEISACKNGACHY